MNINIGMVILFLIFIFPILLYETVKTAHAKSWCNNFPSLILSWLKTHSLIIILLYFFAANAFIAIISPIFVEYYKDSDVLLHALSSSLEDAGYILAMLLIPIVTISILVDKCIKKAGQYSYYFGGYLDPVTGEQNISLRFGTFFDLLNNCGSLKNLGIKVGTDFAKTIKKTNTTFTREAKLNNFCEKWTEADEKASWCTLVKYDENSNILTIEDSIAFKDANSPDGNNKALEFIEGYVYGTLKAIDCNINSVERHNPSGHNKSKKICMFKVNYSEEKG